MRFPLPLALALLLAPPVRPAHAAAAPVVLPAPRAGEVRAVWIATADIPSPDWPVSRGDPDRQKEELARLIRQLKGLGLDTVYFQVVSAGDALYPSAILPWSRVLTGREGGEPGYDPLAVAVRTARECGMRIHAWINPLRADNSLDTVHAARHVLRTHPEWCHRHRDRVWLDPGEPAVRAHVASIAREIVSRYAVDGLQIDDYFYPDGLRGKAAAEGWDDRALFARHGGGRDLDRWRTENIDALVRDLHAAVHGAAAGPVVFGVSPAGRQVNSLRLYANPSHWVEAGTVDYLVPQIYWASDRADEAAFARALAEWKPLARKVPVYAGLAAYKHDPRADGAFASPADRAFRAKEEFARQLAVCRSSGWVGGAAWFRARHLFTTDLAQYLPSTLYPARR
ncbi:MAG: family 10 glycosylhydrolase [Kiritimatiellae bacterium]|nr:family 10 glycosylhydrolase [Kiritimatiellia bacterium]